MGLDIYSKLKKTGGHKRITNIPINLVLITRFWGYYHNSNAIHDTKPSSEICDSNDLVFLCDAIYTRGSANFING